MSNSITIHPLNINSPEIEEAVELYVEAFPSCERRDTEEWLKCISSAGTPPFVLFGIFLDHEFMGFFSCWNFNGFVYGEHFAVKKAARGHGVGATAVSLIKAYIGIDTPFIIEVEPPCDEMATRRIGFYQRQGFVVDETPYLQPPYRQEDQWFELKLMSTHPEFLTNHFEEVKQAIYQNVYHVEAKS